MMHKVEYFLFNLLCQFLLLLPLGMAQRFGSFLGIIAYHLLAKRRSIALENLRQAFPEKEENERESIAKGSFRNFGISMAELLWFPKLNDEMLHKILSSENIHLVKEAAEKGKGLIVLSGHFGNWELIASGIARLSRLPFTIIVQRQSNKMVDEVINRNRCLYGNRVVPMGISVREILTTLQGGGVIAIAPDQSAPKEGVYVNFFGKMTATHQGPAVFALRCRSPILMGFLVRQRDKSYKTIIEEIDYTDITGKDEIAIEQLTQRHTNCLEQYIRQYPDHWLWMHRRWKNIR
jgi:Kdo2-lipid IVA lauroyltransferase/acyltransferase